MRRYIALGVSLCQLTALVGITEQEYETQRSDECWEKYELPLMKKREELKNTFFFNWQKRTRLQTEIEDLQKQKREADCFKYMNKHFYRY